MTSKQYKMLHKRLFFFVSVIFLPFVSKAVNYSITDSLHWKNPQTIYITETDSLQRLLFSGAHYSGLDVVPHFYKSVPVHSADIRVEASFVKIQTVNVTAAEEEILRKSDINNNRFTVEAGVGVSRKQPYVDININPVRFNSAKGTFEKLVQFEVNIQVEDDYTANGTGQRNYADNSVLSTGEWYKVRIDTSGIFRLTWESLNSMGFPVNSNPAYFAVFGNGGGILPEKNDEPRPDDLTQIPIEVVGGNDGTFDPGDYILFYGEGPVVAKYNPFNGAFIHQTNYYDNYSYYYVTKLDSPGERIQESDGSSNTPQEDVTSFTDVVWHEIDKENLGAIGRTWYGEVFDFNLKQDFVYNFPNIIKDPTSYFYIKMASKAYSSNSANIYINDVQQKTLPLPVTLSNGYEFGRERDTDFTFTPKDNTLKITIEFKRSSTASVGYLDYFGINVKRNLIFSGNQMIFRNVFSESETVRFKMQNAANTTVWDITNPLAPVKMKNKTPGSSYTFVQDVDNVKQFIAFDGNLYFEPEFVERVDNQNLHAVKNIDYLIITHPGFLEQANRLADFHRMQDNMKVYVTTPQKIYNEFSSGSQDITAIRDFVKMVYDKSDSGEELKYLLLLGDASYDYKDMLQENTNYVPCWESVGSLNLVTSVASDDYFGYLDDGEGASDNDRVDVGIGRFPVTTPEEAQMAVDKCIHYATKAPEVMGPWRNEITFVADDEDSNHHLSDAETLAGFVNNEEPVYNLNKIYVDAYEQISTPSGQRAPDVNRAINNKIEQGTLIFNYSGHGGEIGLGHERFMQIADIQSWTNYDKLAVFITATCEFTRYDDPSRTSAGELVFLNPNGGGIGLFTTSRATYASSNLALNLAIYNDNMFRKEDGRYPCLGDIIRRSKVLGNDNDKKFVLIGDPALQMAYPGLHAVTTEVNNNPVNISIPDTLQALSTVVISGIITDEDNNMQSDFNGTIYPTVFDKKTAVLTLGTDDGSSPTTFYMWKSIIFKGKAPVTGGRFTFEFMVPKDISYNYGIGRISYYFSNDSVDGNGYYENIIVGGFNEDAVEDVNGPVIKLFMNDVTFQPGDVTDENPELLAKVSDESGINTTGSGIGHDIIAKIDNDPNLTFNLNDFYEADEGDYRKGTITYPFNNLKDGEHTLTLKVWDVYNNSSEAVLPFVVTASEQFVITSLMNRPNPVTDHTEFVFEHNQPGKEMDVEIRVFNMSGELIKRMTAKTSSAGYQSEPLRWNCTTDSNRKIGRGIYVYSLIATTEDGKTAVKKSKLVFLR